MDKNGVSIIICTYNRADLLTECLESFVTQTIFPANMEIIVVNNNSTDNTEAVVETFKGKLTGLSCVNETNIGLSYARNRGVKESVYDWVCYMDDDAKAHKNYVERLFYVMNNCNYDGFGGMFYPWYRSPKPAWLSPEFGKMTLLRTTLGPLAKGKTVAGGICAFNKEKLLKAGGFPNDIGMRGDVVGYGEENYLQDNMWANGDTIGFDPDWKMDHLVAEYKYTLSWHLKRNFGKGRDYQISKGSLSFIQKLIHLFRAIVIALVLGLKNLPRLFTSSTYYRQNWILDAVGYSYKMFGKISV